MMRDLLLRSRFLLPLLLLTCAPLATYAQVDDVDVVIGVDDDFHPSIAFEGFVNDCAGIQFRYVPAAVTTIFNRVRWTTDNGSVDLPAGTPFILTQPSSQVSAQQFFSSNFFVCCFGTTVSLPTPPLAAFDVDASPNSVKLCEHDIDFFDLTSNRCVGSMDWEITDVIPIVGSAAGITVFLDDQVGGAGFDPTSTANLVVLTQSLAAPAVIVYEVEATETLSGNTREEYVLVFTDPACSGTIGGFDISDKVMARMISLGKGKKMLSSADVRWVYDQLNRSLSTSSYSSSVASDKRGPETTEASAAVEVPESMVAFPNPASDELNLRWAEQPTAVRLIDMNGRTVLSLTGEQLSTEQSRISVAELKVGLYVVDAVYEGGRREAIKVQIVR